MDMEKVLKLAAKTQEFAPNDELTELVEAVADELSEEDLDLVAAASAAPDYKKISGLYEIASDGQELKPDGELAEEYRSL